MFTLAAESTRKTFSAAAALAIVSFGGLVMDQAYLAAAPQGSIEIGELTALDGRATLAQLPEVVVVAKRESATRSEEHTSELQSQSNLVCRLLLEKKKKEIHHTHHKDRPFATTTPCQY